MKRRNPRKRSGSRNVGLAEALNSLLKGEKITPENLAQKASQQKRFVTEDDMDDAFEEALDSGLLAVADEEDSEDYDEEYSEEDSEFDIDFDEDDDFRSGRDLVFTGRIEGGRRGERREGLEKYDRDWLDIDDEDPFGRENNPTLFTPLNIGIGVVVLGVAGFFGYKHFTKSDDKSNS